MKTILSFPLLLAAGLAVNVHAATNAPQALRVTGKVVDAAGNPIAGATVGYWLSDSRPPFLNLPELKERKVTVADGTFEFLMSPGPGLLVASKAGLAPAWTPYLQPRTKPEQLLVMNTPTVLAGKVLDEAGKPLANAEVFVSSALLEKDLGEGARSYAYLSGKLARDHFSTRTSADGRFRVEGFPTNASADLLVQAPGKAIRLPSSRIIAGGSARQYVAGQEDIELTVEPAGSIEGKIFAEGNSQPIPAAWLLLESTEPTPFSSIERKPIESRADGTFRISDLPAGSYRLLATFSTNATPEWVAETVTVSVDSGQTKRDVKIQVIRGGLLDVAVLNKKDRQPVTQASVNAIGRVSQFQSIATSADDGVARLRLLPGDYQLYASGETAGTSESTSATVEAGRTNRVEIELSPPPRITGVVRLPDGKPAAGIEVRIVPGYALNSEAMRTDADGKFDLEWSSQRIGLGEVTPCLLAREPERNLAVAQDIDENAGPLDLRLAPALTLAGRAEAGGKPVTNVTAQLIFWTGRSGMHLRGLARTNTPGQFEIPALPPGRKYGVIISAPGHGQKQMTNLEISADPGRQELDPVELKLANLSLAGQVLDMDDKPVAGISVSLSGEGQPNANARTDREGRFRFSQVCEGPARIYANAQNSYGSMMAGGGDTNVVLRLGQNYSTTSASSRALRLKGVVTDLDDQPVAGAQVEVFPDNSVRVKTGTNGAFSLTWTLQPWQLQSGNAMLVVRDTVRNLAASEALDQETTNVSVKLKPALTVTGLVKTSADAPLARAQVGLWLRAGNSYNQLNEQMPVTDAQGRFEIKCLPPDEQYQVFATAKGYGRSQQQVQGESGTNRLELEPLVLRLADQVVAGQVVDENDKPVSGVDVRVVNVISAGEGQPDGNVSTDSKGRFRLQVCEGRVRLMTSSGSGIAQATVEAGDTNVMMTLRSRSASGARVIGEPAGRVALRGRPLPDLTSCGLSTEAAASGKPLLVCLLDAEQRPSRRVASLLAGQYDALRGKGVAVVAIQAVVASAESFQTWTNSSPLPFPVGRIAEKSANTKWAADVESLPWFILRDAGGKVAAEGFALDELDTKLEALKK